MHPSGHYIGVDLAWGEEKPTGLAVLDAHGTLLHLGVGSDDASIVEQLRPFVDGPCLVAMDAPLIVVNATGNRPAEAALNRDFARFDAGAHPANTGRPEFAQLPRGQRLARALGLDIDPNSSSDRRAIEVYPHPATVALFGLGRTLKYKNKPRRTLEGMRAEMLRLTGLLETLGQARPPLMLVEGMLWRTIVGAVEQAERKSELRHVEDQLDAIVCAYVAAHADQRPEDTTVYGDLATGYIVTPTLPDGQQPTPRNTADTGPVDPVDVARVAAQAYAAELPQIKAATSDYVEMVTTMLDEAGINYLSVSGRAKSVTSYAGKAERLLATAPDLDPVAAITDEIGVRVITYVHSDVAAVADLLAQELRVLDDRDLGQETADEGRFGYASRHMLVELSDDHDHPTLQHHHASVQIRTVLQHAWAEFEHDIRYKGTVPAAHVSDLDRRFTLAAGLIELADREFSTIRERLRSTTALGHSADAGDPRIDQRELATFLDGQFVDSGWSRSDHYAWISGLLLELGITSLEELGGLLSSIDDAAINARMDYRYPPGAVRRLDDALLAVFGARYLELHGNGHRQELLEARLDKLRPKLEP